MADVTPILINQLAAQTTLSDSDYFIVGGSDAKKITVAQMKEALGINALNGNIEVKSYGLISYASESIDLINVVCRKQGKVVSISGYFSLTKSITANINFMHINSELEPHETTYFPIMASKSTNLKLSLIHI